MNPTQRKLRARMAAHTRWAACEDRAAATAKATAASQERFARQALERFPDDTPEQHRKRVESLKKAHYARMQLARHS